MTYHRWGDKFKEGKTKELEILNSSHFQKLGIVPHDDPKGPDFVLGNGWNVELKSEIRYTFNKKLVTNDGKTLYTGNGFFERFSDDRGFKAGGLWKAELDNSQVYLHYDSKDKTVFMFRTHQILNELKKRIADGDLKEIIGDKNLGFLYAIRNKTYNTLGWAIIFKSILNSVPHKEIKI